ncbi:MAG: hypothetical protein JW931_02995 [Methanomicrobiaceae archaeon]|nr:hypothetical protein [Methanomicrobiaceae archaeon]
MDENSKTLLILLSGMLVILAAFLVIAGNIYPDGFGILGITPDSSYSYEVSLVSSGTLHNVTMFLPLPSDFENSPVGFGILEGKGYGIPENMDSEIYGEGKSLFLKIILPETEGFKFGINLDYKVLIDTFDPIKCSHVIRPVYDLQSGEGTDVYNTYIYTLYDASPETEVTIDIHETGMNSWKTFSEKKNYFEEYVSLTLTGSQKKWQTAGVSLNKRKGDYSILF